MKKLSFYSLSLVLGTSSLFLLAETSAKANLPIEKTQLPLPNIELTAENLKNEIEKEIENASSESLARQEHELTIQKNGSLSQALSRIGIGAKTSYQIRKTKQSHLLTKLRAGDKLQVWTNNTGALTKILYPKSRTHQIQLTEQNGEFVIREVHLPVETRIVSRAGIIEDSFYLSGEKAGLSAKTIMNLADIFGWEIDFIRQLRKGDPFKIIYEKRYLNGEYIGDGKILAAEMTTGGKDKHEAYLLEDENGEFVGYYDEKQKNLKKAFLRNPVDYVRITSGYTKRRFHPIQKKWKAHRGIDYGGPIGTPIRTTGNGKIQKRYRSKSYGNVIYVNHAGKYTTVYAHLSRFGKYRVGQYVKQGQVIGYLGNTGWSTGPHLHYEFRENGRHRDPLKMKFPDAGPVDKKYRKAFKQYASLMSSQLDRVSVSTQLAGYFE